MWPRACTHRRYTGMPLCAARQCYRRQGFGSGFYWSHPIGRRQDDGSSELLGILRHYGATTRFVRNRTPSHLATPEWPFTYGRLRKAMPQTAAPGDSPFKILFQNRVERQTVRESSGRRRFKDGPSGVGHPHDGRLSLYVLADPLSVRFRTNRVVTPCRTRTSGGSRYSPGDPWLPRWAGHGSPALTKGRGIGGSSILRLSKTRPYAQRN